MKTFGSILRTRVAVAFIAIILLSSIIRFTSLASVPVSLYWDEVSEGYNSFSILRTGKDEYGITLPLLFRGYDDYKMPVYIYLSVIPIALFGLTEFSVRFTSAFLGVGTVVMCFFLVKELFEKEKYKISLALFSSFLFAIVPWHVQLSRAGFEANVALFFVVVGCFAVLRGLRNTNYLFLASLVFALSVYSYRSSLIVVPLLFFAFLFILKSNLLQNNKRKYTLLAFSIFIILTIPLTFKLVKNGDARTSEVSIFSAENSQIRENSIKQYQAGNTFISKIIYNRRFTYAKEAVSNYVLNFSLDFLFLKGDINPRHSLGNIGMLYVWQLPFILVGLVFLLKEMRIQAYLVIIWIALAPLAASFSVPSPHALRSLLMLPPLLILTSFGVCICFEKLKRNRWVLGYVLLLVITGNALLYGKAYIEHNTVTASGEWGDGYKQLVTTVEKLSYNFDKVIITGHYWQPYMYTLFYTKYDPRLFQNLGSKMSFSKYIFGGTSWDQRLSRQELGNIDLLKVSGSKNTLVALSPDEYKLQQKNLQKLSDIKNHNGQTIFILGTLQ